MKIAILEDNLDELREIKALVDRYLAAQTLDVAVDAFRTARAFLAGYESNRYELVLLDCYLDSTLMDLGQESSQGSSSETSGEANQIETGFDVAKRIRKADSKCQIVFITSSRDFAVESYEVDAKGYLLKPVTYERVAEMLDKIGLTELAGLAESDQRTVNIAGCDIVPADVMWAKASGHYVDLYMTHGEPLRLRVNFSDVQDALNAAALAYPSMQLRGQVGSSQIPSEEGQRRVQQFYSCARGYLVNLDDVVKIKEDEYVLYNGSRVPISRRNFKAAREAWSAWSAQSFE